MSKVYEVTATFTGKFEKEECTNDFGRDKYFYIWDNVINTVNDCSLGDNVTSKRINLTLAPTLLN